MTQPDFVSNGRFHPSVPKAANASWFLSATTGFCVHNGNGHEPRTRLDGGCLSSALPRTRTGMGGIGRSAVAVGGRYNQREGHSACRAGDNCAGFRSGASANAARFRLKCDRLKPAGVNSRTSGFRSVELCWRSNLTSFDESVWVGSLGLAVPKPA